MLQQVELASNFFNIFFQLATTTFFCVQTIFEVGGNATMLFNLQRNICKLKENVARITGPLQCTVFYLQYDSIFRIMVSLSNNTVFVFSDQLFQFVHLLIIGNPRYLKYRFHNSSS